MQHMKNTSCELDKPIVVGFKTCARWRHSDIIKKSNNNNSTDSLFVCCVDGCFLCVHNGIHPSLIKCVLLLKRFNLVKGKNGLYIFMTNQKGGWLVFVFLRWKQKENAAAIADKCSSSFVFMTQMLTRTARVCYYTRIENKKEEKNDYFFLLPMLIVWEKMFFLLVVKGNWIEQQFHGLLMYSIAWGSSLSSK